MEEGLVAEGQEQLQHLEDSKDSTLASIPKKKAPRRPSLTNPYSEPSAFPGFKTGADILTCRWLLLVLEDTVRPLSSCPPKKTQLPLGLFVIHITLTISPGSSRGKMDRNRGKGGK